MSKFMYNGKPYGGSTNYASSVACTDAEGNESTVQAEIEKNRDDIDELNKKFVFVDVVITEASKWCYTPYPNGFSLYNTFIVGANIIFNDAEKDIFPNNSTSTYTISNVSAEANGIGVFYSNSSYVGKTVRVLITKKEW